ncbi:MAG: hypothetical protein LW629_08875 [Burkholderiales bacterium]|nr:hypothetical protein [Burkholderiales bacterium]
MSNILLVDTSFSSAPIYQFLVDAGHNVTVVGGNPEDALAKSAYSYVNFDYSDTEKLSGLIADRKIDYLVPGCNDRSYAVCAEVNADRKFPGLDSLEVSEIINNKEKFRAFASSNDLSVPKVLTERELGFRWPVMVKPVDSFSGRGVTILQEKDKAELPMALNHARQASKEALNNSS